jgi:hypothetical protein
MQIRPPKLLTVGNLLNYLKRMEEYWTEEDTKYMGDFRNHMIYVPYFKRGEFIGYGHGEIHYDGGLDFIIDMPQEEIQKDGR